MTVILLSISGSSPHLINIDVVPFVIPLLTAGRHTYGDKTFIAYVYMMYNYCIHLCICAIKVFFYTLF